MWILPPHASFPARSTRREWLRGCTLGACALSGLGWIRGRRANAADDAAWTAGGAAAAPGFGRAKSVLLVFTHGGQSQLDLWDPKPAAPLEVRGEFAAIETAVRGLHFGEHLPRTARVADRLTVLRSMSHEDLDHGSAVYLALTGSYHAQRSGNPPISPTDLPTFGAVLRRVAPAACFAHDAVHLNGPALVPAEPGPGQNGGLLGRAYEPLVVGDVREAAGALPGLALQTDLPLGRMDDRLALLARLEKGALGERGDRQTLDFAASYGQAFEMLASPRTRQAFDLAAEPLAVRERYGLDRTGQAMLLARRLVEAGVPFVNVICNQSNRGQDDAPDVTDTYGWDTHNDIFTALRDRLLPRFDLSFSALIEDLDQRGLLDQTLVVCMGEFGRAPRVALERNFAGTYPGRKHWAKVYSILLAGAGVARGAVVGASDKIGGEATTERYGPWDVLATMFHALGISPAGHYTDPLDRPFAISAGRPIRAVYGGT